MCPWKHSKHYFIKLEFISLRSDNCEGSGQKQFRVGALKSQIRITKIIGVLTFHSEISDLHSFEHLSILASKGQACLTSK